MFNLMFNIFTFDKNNAILNGQIHIDLYKLHAKYNSFLSSKSLSSTYLAQNRFQLKLAKKNFYHTFTVSTVNQDDQDDVFQSQVQCWRD